MTAAVRETHPRKLSIIWLAPLQAASMFTVWAIGNGGETLRLWIVAALVWLMSLPLLAGLEGTLLAMMLFEPFRGLIRRAQYLFLNYTDQDPIHVITPLVTLFAFGILLRKQRMSILWSTPLAGWVSVLAGIFFLEIFNPLQGSLFIGLTGALFMLVPVAWFFFGHTVDEKFMHAAFRLVVLLGILGSLYGLYQLMFGYPAFEQYWIDNTDNYQSIGVGRVQRALATFSSAEEWGRYAQIGGIICLAFTGAAKRMAAKIGWLVCAAALFAGILLSGQRTAVFGFIIGVVALLLLSARNARTGLLRAMAFLLPLLLLFVLVKPPSEEEEWNKAEDERLSTVLTHTQRGTMKPAGEDSLQVRFDNWGYLLTSVVPYRPLGAGIGAGSVGDVRTNASFDLPPIDNFVLVMAVTCGIPGALLFIWILLRATHLSIRLRRHEFDEGTVTINRIAAAVMPVLILNSVFGLTFSIYSVAPIAWLLIGWTSAQAARATKTEARETIVI